MMQKFLLWLILVTLSAMPKVGFGQTLDLGTTSGFSLFTANGALTNAGASVVSGDIGTNVGAISGFEAASVTGNTRPAGSAQSMQAALDVVSAYNSIGSFNCGTQINSELGGQTLSPGISCQSTASPTTLNGTLTLSGSGTFIIKLSSALVTATNSSIVLTNGATANNVFFRIEGAATLGTGSTFKGTILALGAITLNTTALEGRALSTTGAITLNASNITAVAAPSPLPVSLTSFTARAQANHTVRIDWTTSLETNNKSFLIERSKDLRVFETVSIVSELAPMSNALKTYNLVDAMPYAGTSYYRLTQTDLNGKASVYPAVSVVLRDDAYGVYPNPVVGEGRFGLRLDEPETATITFYSTDGHALPLQKTGIESGNLLLKMSSKLTTGVYLLTVEERGQSRQHRIVVE
ncbi:ice-binding family protein [Spirosoma pulveris]